MMNHNDFPKMTDAFDQRIHQTLDSLSEQPQRVRRFPFKRAVSRRYSVRSRRQRRLPAVLPERYGCPDHRICHHARTGYSGG